MKNEIKKIIKKMNGHVLGIGINDDTYINELNKNSNIIKCDLLNEIVNGKSNYYKKGKTKKINIKKIKKIFKKKRINYILCDYEDIKKYLRHFIKNSVYINKDTIYIYGILDKYEINDLIRIYKRYNVKPEVIKYEEETIIIIDTTNSKSHPFRNIFYNIIDIGSWVADVIGGVLTS